MSTAAISVDELLSRAVVEIIDKAHLTKQLKSGRRLRVKYGIDPTGRDIHFGHAVPIRLLRRFQILGHQVVFIVGDFTAMIGDPSGRLEARPALSHEQTREFAKTYFDQAFKLLDREATEIHYNSEWFHDFDLKKTIHLLSHSSISQILSHATFRERLKKAKGFFVHEILYPLLQGYDSVAVKADVEVGGLDQKFNLLMGRQVQTAFGQPPQDIVLMEYLIGTDGQEKMSKSLGNYIAITDTAADMYGKVMSLPDKLIMPYFTLATDVTDEAILLVEKELKNGANPRDLKMRLARELVEEFHGAEAAEEAGDAFKTRFQLGGPVVADEEIKISRGQHTVVDLLVKSGLAKSKSEARRKIAEKAVDVFVGEAKRRVGERFALDRPTTIRLGKRFVKVIPK